MKPDEATPIVRDSDAADESFEQAVGLALEAGEVAGVVAIAATADDIIYQGALGWRDRDAKIAITMDTVFMMASMTKMVTAIAAMQLVEQGRLSLDEPLARLDPEFANARILEGFDDQGAPRLRRAARPITLRALLTHTSGYGHNNWSADLERYQQATGIPPLSSQTNASLRLPLLFEPGERWEYGIGLEWAGKVIEAASGQTLGAYFRDHVTGPLGMRDTAFGIVPAHLGRLATVFQRDADESLRAIELTALPGEYEAGGGGLYGTAGDYLALLRMLLNDGVHEGKQILQAATVDLMGENHMGEIHVATMKSTVPNISNDFELYPDMAKKWGLGAMITPQKGPNGRSPGTLAWGGIANCYFWLDPTKRIIGIFMTQIMPFGDPKALELCAVLERQVYRALA